MSGRSMKPNISHLPVPSSELARLEMINHVADAYGVVQRSLQQQRLDLHGSRCLIPIVY